MTTAHAIRGWLRTRSGMAAVIAFLGAALAIVTRGYYITHVDVYQPLRGNTDFGGAAEYYRYAWNLVHHHVFSQAYTDAAQPVPDSFRDPGYPLYLAIFMALSSSYESFYGLVVLSHALLGGITVACMVLALRHALPTWALAFVAAAAAVWPHSVVIASCVLSENLTAPLWAIAILALHEAAARRSMPFSVLAGLALAAASLTNSVLAPLVVPLVVVFAWKKAMSWRLLIVLALAATLPVATWSVRNAMVGSGNSSTFRAEVNLVQGSWPTYHLATQLEARHDPVGIQTARAINAEIDALQANPASGLKIMAARMMHAPGTHIAWYLRKPALLWGWQIGLGAGGVYIYPTNHSPYIEQPLWKAIDAGAFIFNGAIAALALAGTLLALARRQTETAMLALAVTAAWITLVYAVLQSDPRYSIPFRSGEFALAAFAVWTAIRWARRPRGDRAHSMRG